VAGDPLAAQLDVMALATGARGAAALVLTLHGPKGLAQPVGLVGRPEARDRVGAALARLDDGSGHVAQLGAQRAEGHHGPMVALRGRHEERQHARQVDAGEEVVAVHGRVHALGLGVVGDVAGVAVAPADQQPLAALVHESQREAQAQQRGVGALVARWVVPVQPERRIADHRPGAHAGQAQQRVDTLQIAVHRGVVAGGDLIAVDLHAEAPGTGPGGQQRAVAGGGVKRRRPVGLVAAHHLGGQLGRLGWGEVLLQPLVADAAAQDRGAGGHGLLGQRAAVQARALLAALRAVGSVSALHGHLLSVWIWGRRRRRAGRGERLPIGVVGRTGLLPPRRVIAARGVTPRRGAALPAAPAGAPRGPWRWRR
jgi:hypothetical protein